MATATLKPPINLPGGYTTEVDYGRVFSSELTPNFLNYVALINCVKPIALESRFNYRYYLEYFGLADSSLFKNEAKYLTSIPP